MRMKHSHKQWCSMQIFIQNSLPTTIQQLFLSPARSVQRHHIAKKPIQSYSLICLAWSASQSSQAKQGFTNKLTNFPLGHRATINRLTLVDDDGRRWSILMIMRQARIFLSSSHLKSNVRWQTCLASLVEKLVERVRTRYYANSLHLLQAGQLSHRVSQNCLLYRLTSRSASLVRICQTTFVKRKRLGHGNSGSLFERKALLW